MILNLKTQFSTENYSCLCFKHAVLLAFNGKDVEIEIDEFGGEGDMRSTLCQLCL